MQTIEWIQCKDQLPPKLKLVVVDYGNDYEFAMIFKDGWKIIKDGEWYELRRPLEITRWHPLAEM